MAFVLKLLGAGATNAGTLTVPYSVTSPTTGAIVSNLRLANTTVGNVTTNVFFKPSGGSQIRLAEKDKVIPANDILTVKSDLTMATGDAIEVTTSAAIDYVVCGLARV